MFSKSLQISQENTCAGVSFYKVAGLRACNFIKRTLQHRCLRVKFAKFLGIPIFKNIRERLLLFFQYNSHHHFHYHHFHYHRKIHFNCLKILLTIPLDCNMIPCLLQLNFVFFLPTDIFLQSYSKLFVFLRPVKGLRIRLRPADKFRCSLYTYIYIYSFLHFLIYT